MSNNRMCGTEEEFMYGYAWSILRGRAKYENFQHHAPDAAIEIARAIEVIRSNRPEYRKVFIKGLDDASVDNPQ